MITLAIIVSFIAGLSAGGWAVKETQKQKMAMDFLDGENQKLERENRSLRASAEVGPPLH